MKKIKYKLTPENIKLRYEYEKFKRKRGKEPYSYEVAAEELGVTRNGFIRWLMEPPHFRTPNKRKCPGCGWSMAEKVNRWINDWSNLLKFINYKRKGII